MRGGARASERRRFVDSFPAWLVTALGVVAASAIASPVAAQGGALADPRAAPPSGWRAPRTEWGHPDLQGNWTNGTLTPTERPAGQGPTLSWEQVAVLEGRADARLAASSRPSDPDRPAPPVGGDGSTGAAGGVGGYNGIYIDRGDRVAVVNGEPRTSLVTEPADGQIPAITAEARRRAVEFRAPRAGFGAYDHPELRPLGERCIISFGSTNGPPMLPNGFYNNNYTIVQNADHVMIMTEMVHDVRIVKLGERQPLPDHMLPWFGDSWGRWEGETLVVETTNIHPDQTVGGARPAPHTKVVERFTRVDGETILYEFRIDDPSTFERAWGGQVPMYRMDDLLYEYACHEGNYALENILSGARYQERMEAGGASGN